MLPFPIISNTNIVPPKKNIKKVFGSSGSIFVLYDTGILMSVGYNGYGQLGLGHVNNMYGIWSKYSYSIKDGYGTANGIFLITTTNRVLYAGVQYAIGNSTTPGYYNKYIDITDTVFSTIDVSKIKDIRGAEWSTLVLLNDGTLWGCGRNNLYQLGTGNTTIYSTLVLISSDVQNVSASTNFTSYVKISSGTYIMYWMGTNSSNAFGTAGSSPTPTIISGSSNYIQLMGNQISNSTYANTVTKMVYTRGSNIFGQLGTGSNTDSNAYISTSYTGDLKGAYSSSCVNPFDTFIVTSTGIKCCGWNRYGVLGTGTVTDSNTWVNSTLSFNPQSIKDFYSSSAFNLVQLEDSTLYYIGEKQYIYGGVSDISTSYIKITVPYDTTPVSV